MPSTSIYTQGTPLGLLFWGNAGETFYCNTSISGGGGQKLAAVRLLRYCSHNFYQLSTSKYLPNSMFTSWSKRIRNSLKPSFRIQSSFALSRSSCLSGLLIFAQSFFYDVARE